MEKKKVDESWKKTVESDKKKSVEAKPTAPPETSRDKTRELPSPDFVSFVATLAAQVMMALGEIPNPMTQKKETDLPQAKYLIDLINLLKEKTKGNLDETENKNLEGMLANLQMAYVKMSGQKKT